MKNLSTLYMWIGLCIFAFTACDTDNTTDSEATANMDRMGGSDSMAGTESMAGSDSTAGTEANDTITATYESFDYLLWANGVESPVTGLTAKYEDQMVTDEEKPGTINVELPPNELFEIELTKDMYYPYHLFGRSCDGTCGETGDNTFYVKQPLVSIEAGNLLAGSLGVELGLNETGTVIAAAYQKTFADDGSTYTISVLPDVKISLDVASSVTLTEDSSNATGLTAGDTTVSGGVVFVNAESGAVTVKVEPPEGFTSCSIAPGNGAENEAAITVYPLAVSIVDFFCDRAGE